jgi:hypothetical protein
LHLHTLWEPRLPAMGCEAAPGFIGIARISRFDVSRNGIVDYLAICPSTLCNCYGMLYRQ